mmetsp:Transcript_849/g.2735  ORF Transcript_849/g.2735 Transcript_849/m.2735 type:complete len:118 (-) Transcript_849:281-634(-)
MCVEFFFHNRPASLNLNLPPLPSAAAIIHVVAAEMTWLSAAMASTAQHGYGGGATIARDTPHHHPSIDNTSCACVPMATHQKGMRTLLHFKHQRERRQGSISMVKESPPFPLPRLKW